MKNHSKLSKLSNCSETNSFLPRFFSFAQAFFVVVVPPCSSQQNVLVFWRMYLRVVGEEKRVGLCGLAPNISMEPSSMVAEENPGGPTSRGDRGGGGGWGIFFSSPEKRGGGFWGVFFYRFFGGWILRGFWGIEMD